MSITENIKTPLKPYWIPKTCKLTVGTRLIFASKQYAKPLIKYKYIEKCHIKSKVYSQVNFFWVIQNHKPVIDTLNKLSNRKTAKFISVYLIIYQYIT